ncbi:MAG: hypothetical protein V1720_16345 [bacterium]
MQKQFAGEIKMLNTLYSEMVEAILNKPDTADYEKARIYFENVVAHMNKWTSLVNQIKKQLEERDSTLDLSTDNPPV